MKIKRPEAQIMPLEMRHAPFIQRYASDAAVAAMTTIPHPYPENGAEEYVRYDQSRREKGAAFTYAVIAEETFVGVCSVGLDKCDRQGRPELELLDRQAVLGARIRIRGGARCVDARLFGTRLPVHRRAEP